MLDWIKRHPYLTAALVVGLIVLILIFRARSASAGAGASTAAAGPSEALQAAQLSASTQLQGAQIAAGVAASNANAAVAAQQVQANAQVQIAQLKQQEDLQNIVTSGQVQSQNISAGLQAVQAQTGAQVAINAETVAGTTELARVQTAGQVQIAGFAAQTNQDEIAAAAAEQESINATQLGLAQTAAAVSVNQTNQAAKVSIANIGLQTDVVNRQADIAYTQLVQSGATQRQAISTTGAVETTAIQTAGATQRSAIGATEAVDLSQLGYAHETQAGVLDLLQSGALGNPNRAAVASNLIAPGSGGPIAVSGNAANANIFSGFLNLASRVGSSLFGGV